MKSEGELSHVCSQIVLKCLYLARIGRPHILWSVNKLARSIGKWTRACDKRLNRLISYIHHTCEYKQYCYVSNTAKHCRLGLFQDSDFAGDLEDSKSISGGTLCVLGSHTFVPISWMCKKQTSVSHSPTVSEIISLDAGLRLDGLPALELWDLIVSVFGSVTQTTERTERPVDTSSASESPGKKSYESQSPWSAKAEKYDRTGQPVVGGDPRTAPGYHHKQFVESSYSARYSGWDDDKAWSSREWKADELMDDRKETPVVCSRARTHEFQSRFSREHTRCLPSTRSKATAIHHWRRRNRIGFVVRIQIILKTW